MKNVLSTWYSVPFIQSSMQYLRFLAPIFHILILVACCALAGCGKSESGTKLPEAEQQKQIQELNQQRVDEWGNKAK